MSNQKIDLSGIDRLSFRSKTDKKPNSSGIEFDDEKGDLTSIIIQKSHIEELFGERKSNMRFYNFVWLYLFLNENANFEEENIGVREPTLADIEYFLSKESSEREAKGLANLIREDYRKQCIPADQLNWISSSTRSIKWFKEKIDIIDQYDIHQFINLNGFPLILAIIDQWKVRSSFKKNLISEFQRTWEANIKSDHELSWLEDKSFAKERRNLAWGELSGKYGGKFKVDRVPSTYQDILEIFDQLVEEGISKKSFIRSLQNKQSKQKNIDDRRKAKNLDILLENHSKLKELATQWKVTEREAMDKLISEAFGKVFGKEASTPD